MDVRNCKGCGKLFNYISGPPLCPTCAKALDAKFEEVKAYVYEHPRVDIQEVAEVFEISVAQIKQWIREERLSFADDSMIGLDCEKCGAIIRTGRYCKACKDKLAKGFQELYPSPKPPSLKPQDTKTSARMRFLDQDRD